MPFPYFGIPLEDEFALGVTATPVSASPSSFVLPPGEYRSECGANCECRCSPPSTPSFVDYSSSASDGVESDDELQSEEFTEGMLALTLRRVEARGSRSCGSSYTESYVDLQFDTEDGGEFV